MPAARRATPASSTRMAITRWSTWGREADHSGGVNAGMCDGSVRFMKNTIARQRLQALSTTAGGEVISSDAY